MHTGGNEHWQTWKWGRRRRAGEWASCFRDNEPRNDIGQRRERRDRTDEVTEEEGGGGLSRRMMRQSVTTLGGRHDDSMNQRWAHTALERERQTQTHHRHSNEPVGTKGSEEGTFRDESYAEIIVAFLSHAAPLNQPVAGTALESPAPASAAALALSSTLNVRS